MYICIYTHTHTHTHVCMCMCVCGETGRAREAGEIEIERGRKPLFYTAHRVTFCKARVDPIICCVYPSYHTTHTTKSERIVEESHLHR